MIPPPPPQLYLNSCKTQHMLNTPQPMANLNPY